MKNSNTFNYLKIAVVFALLSFISLSSTNSTVTIAIIGTNDIHGAAFPAQLIRSDNTSSQYLYGGLQYMGRLIQIIQNQNQGNVLYLDAGDQFQGGIQSSKLVSSGKIMNDFYDALDLNGSAIGNHQFDFGPSFLFPFMSGKEAPNLAANIRSQKGEDVFLPNQQISHLYEFKSGIRIGVIGLSTTETPTTTNAFNSGLFPRYQFLDYLNIVQQQSKKLRRRGADAVLLTTHVGDQCPLNLTYGIWTTSTPQNGCQLGDQMSKLIDTLPAGTIDGVLQGHRHVIAHHFRKGIPYMGSINGGYYFNVMYLTFNSKKQIVNRTIQGPIPVCQKVFQNLGRCNYLTKTQIKDAGPLVSWRFHNQEVYAHPKIKAIYEQEWVPKMSPYLQELVISQIPLQMSYQRQNQLANIMTTIMHNALPKTDFVILNPGGFRTTWVPGLIQYQHFYNMFPFDNQLRTFDITGKQLIDMLTLVQNGDKGFYHAWGIQQTVTFNTTNNKTGFISARMANGQNIEFDKIYRGGMTDFLLNGGDDFVKVIGKTYIPRNVRNEGEMKELLKPELKKLQIIKENVWVDPSHLRLIINKVQ